MRSRLSTLIAMFGGVAALVATIVLEPNPLYIWNASESVPIGLYRLRPANGFIVTELVAVQPTEPLATFLDLNGYLPVGVRMLKRVLALPGQTVCRSGLTISVDGIEMGEARDRDDSILRQLPVPTLARLDDRRDNDRQATRFRSRAPASTGGRLHSA